MSEKKPKRIQRKRVRGYNMQEHSQAVNGLPAVSITRPGKWGNPFAIEPLGYKGLYMIKNINTGCYVMANAFSKQDAVKTAVEKYREYIHLSAFDPADKEVLRGQNLACFCKEGEPCHGDVLLEWANS